MFIIGSISSTLEYNKKQESVSLLINSLIKYGLVFSFFVSYFSFPAFWFYIIELVVGRKVLMIFEEKIINGK